MKGTDAHAKSGEYGIMRQLLKQGLLDGQCLQEVHWFPGAAKTKYHKQGGLKQQNLPYSPGGQTSEIKMSAGPCSF